MTLYQRASQQGLSRILEWLPGGERVGTDEYTVRNPTRADANPGSFVINIRTGKWLDYATDDAGGDACSLYAYINGLSQADAAKEILSRYDSSYFPAPFHDYSPSGAGGSYWDGWLQCSKGHIEAPALDVRWHEKNWGKEIERWPLEVKKGSEWNVAMWIVRFPNAAKDGGKADRPFTLWSKGGEYKWRATALEGAYPLYGLRQIVERPNAIVVLCEGQKVASRLHALIGDEYVCVGWYGGAGNMRMSDLEPLRGREVLLPVDGDAAGRRAPLTLKELDIKYRMVYPPRDVEKGWDLADAIASGWAREQVIAFLTADMVPQKKASDVAYLNSTRPTSLECQPDQERLEKMWDYIYEKGIDKKGNEIKVLKDGWYIDVIESDAELRNCLKYDYTVGIAQSAYENTAMLESAIDERLSIYTARETVTKTIIDRVMKYIQRKNRGFNRVADYIDILKQKHGNVGEGVLDEFLHCITFQMPDRENEDDEEYAKKCDAIEEIYREIFDKFFLRMHMRINGTRKRPDGSLYGAIENDIVLILEGGQGTGKTTLCRWLAVEPELYTDLGSAGKVGGSFGMADTVRRVRGTLICEIGEMDIMKRAEDVARVKSFISATRYDLDVKFVERTDPLPATASFIGTSNPAQYLSDDTGNRRFFPIQIADINKEWLASHRETAEKLHAHYARRAEEIPNDQRFDKLVFSRELIEFMEEKRDQAMIRYADHSAIVDIVGKHLSSNGHHDWVCLQNHEVMKIVKDAGYDLRITHASIGSAMQELGFSERGKRMGGKKKNGWWKEVKKSQPDLIKEEIPF